MRRLGRLITTPVVYSLLIAVMAVVYGVLGLPSHGLTSDAPSLFYAGDRTVFWFTHRDVPDALNFLKEGFEPEGFHSAFVRDPEFDDPMHYPVLPGAVAAAVSLVVHERLQWMGAIDAHHLGLVLMHGLALFIECLLLTRLVGRRAAVAATVALALFPAALGHSFNNPKDWPCAQFYACALLAAGIGVLEERARWLFLSAVFVALALSAKLNGVFVLATLALWLPIVWLLRYWPTRRLPGGIVAAMLAMPYIAGALFVVLWPWLYEPPSNLGYHLFEYGKSMLLLGRTTRESWTAFPLLPVIYMTPPLVLACAAFYALAGWRGGRDRALRWSLLLLWCTVPLIRTAAPGANFHDANRHFIEYIPALCVMAGCGFDVLCGLLFEYLAARSSSESPLGGRLPRVLLYMASLVSLAIPVAMYAPYESNYFNVLAGGLGGAQESEGLFADDRIPDRRVRYSEGDYWYSSLRDGLQEIRGHLKGNESIGVCGPSATLAALNWENPQQPTFVDTWRAGDIDSADFVYVVPRGAFCPPSMIEQLQRGRPVLKRVERGGGLIYMILGPRS